MATFEITLSDHTVQHVDDAEAYQQEGPMTTFFATEAHTGRLDAWAIRLASFRSADVLMIRRVNRADGTASASVVELGLHRTG